jgi:hypothetical protein
MNQSIEDASRSVFEAWAELNGYSIQKDKLVEANYVRSPTEYLWKGWQAARQSSQSNEPVGYVSNNFKENLKLGIKIDVSRTPYKHLTMPIYIAAPQQAIPSEPVGELTINKNIASSITEMVREWTATGVENWQGLTNCIHSRLDRFYPISTIPDGFALVPIEPTEEMMRSAEQKYIAMQEDQNKIYGYLKYLLEGYKAMLSASPTAPIERDK